MLEEVLRKGLWRIKKQEANGSETCICLQMTKIKTHTRRGFEERIMENQKTRNKRCSYINKCADEENENSSQK